MYSSTKSESNTRIARNTAFLYIRMFFVLVISLYTSRVVLNTLGVEDYGTYNVVAGFVSLFSFLNATLSSSMQRFYNYEGTRCGKEGYRKVYSTGLIIHITLAILLLIVLETIGLWYVNNIMVVAEGRLFAANMVYQCSILSMLMVIMQIPYIGAIMAKEEMDFYAIISIADVMLKLGAIFVLPYLPYDKLIVYAALILLISIFDTFCYAFYALKRILPTHGPFKMDRELYKSLMEFSGWNLFGTVVFMLKGQGINMILNIFFGPVINAARGIANQVSAAISGFSANVMTAYTPQIVNSYAEENYQRTKKLMFSESKICFLLMLIIAAPVMMEIDYLLQLWLGDIVPDKSSIFAILILIDVLVCTLNTPCTQIVWAVGTIKKYQILTSCVNILLLPCCYVLLMMGFDSTSAFFMTVIISCINQAVALYAANTLFPFGFTDYLKKVILPCLVSVVLIVVPQYLIHYQLESSFIRLFITGLVDITVAIPVLYFIVADSTEKEYINNFIKKIKNR